MQKLFLEYRKSVQRDQKQRWEGKRIFLAFEGNGIDYMPLNGFSLKPMHPAQELDYVGLWFHFREEPKD